jgi:IrrE N-terminal-like domain
MVKAIHRIDLYLEAPVGPRAPFRDLDAELWQRFSLQPGFDVERLLDDLELGLSWEQIDDGADEGDILGQLLPNQGLVLLNERHYERLEARDGAQRRFTISHEVGHWILHVPGGGLGASPFFDGERVLCRDGSRESIERQAEMFAAALLIPRDVLANKLPPAPWSGWPSLYRLAERFAVSPTAMQIRLERLDWMHLTEDREPRSGPAPTAGQGALFAA